MIELGKIVRPKDIGRKGTNGLIWHACISCGKEQWVQLKYGKPRSLCCKSCSNSIDKHPSWKGGRVQDARGYIHIKLSPGDFFYPMVDKKGYVLEHRLTMAKHLGRCLQPWEIVHHKGVRHKDILNKSDNLEDNLQLVTDDRHKQITILENLISQQAKRIDALEQEDNIKKELRADTIYLARRQVALEEALEEWTEFMTTEIFKQDIKLHKHKKSYNYFRESLKDKFKGDYEKFESLFFKINTYFDKEKRTDIYTIK